MVVRNNVRSDISSIFFSSSSSSSSSSFCFDPFPRPILFPHPIHCDKNLRLSCQIAIQRDNPGIWREARVGKGFLQRRGAEPRIIGEVDTIVTREGEGVGDPVAGGPGGAVDEDEGWGGGRAQRGPFYGVGVGFTLVGECMGQGCWVVGGCGCGLWG